MPQDERTAKEKEMKAIDTRSEEDVADFRRMLADVNLLYVGASVLILLDVSYASHSMAHTHTQNARSPVCALSALQCH